MKLSQATSSLVVALTLGLEAARSGVQAQKEDRQDKNADKNADKKNAVQEVEPVEPAEPAAAEACALEPLPTTSPPSSPSPPSRMPTTPAPALMAMATSRSTSANPGSTTRRPAATSRSPSSTSWCTSTSAPSTIKFQPPILLDGKPSSTYYRLEYGGESPACDAGNCRGPHYCSEAVASAGNIWGDFCPYVVTGDNSGKYRHPHLALAALELWIANQCLPENCPATWLDSPNGQNYAADDLKATSITWAEMADNSDPMAQPALPYAWPNAGDGIYPGHARLYGDENSKPSPGLYVTEFFDLPPAATCGDDEEAEAPSAGDSPTAAATDSPTSGASQSQAGKAAAAAAAAAAGMILLA